MPRSRVPGSAVIGHLPVAVDRNRVVVVASGKGGVGTSVAASLLALVCANEGRRVLLIDGNEGNGALHMLFGVRPTLSLDALRDPTVAASSVLIPLAENLSLVASRPAHADQTALTPAQRSTPFERLLPLSAEYDHVIVDAGSRLDNILAATLAGAGVAMLVSDADRISLAANYALIKVFAQRAANVRCSVLVSRHDAAVARDALARMSDACQQFLEKSISLAGSLPDDACLRAALGAAMPIGDAADGSPAFTAMLAVARRILPALGADDTMFTATSTFPSVEQWSQK
ncbi:MAG: AAA family ATPase [bacterium]